MAIIRIAHTTREKIFFLRCSSLSIEEIHFYEDVNNAYGCS
jgi:hypothetical protein